MTKKPSQHTQEPWSLLPVGDANVEIIDGKREPLGILAAFELPEHMDNATRIVACVNACKGIANPSVVQELLALVRNYQHAFETYAMQDMEPEQLQGELEHEVFKKVITERNRIAAVLARAEGRE